MRFFKNSRAVVLGINIQEAKLPPRGEKIIHDSLLGKVAEFRQVLVTKAPEMPKEVLDDICQAATNRYDEIMKNSIGAVKAHRSGMKAMYEKYYSTERGRLDDCENRIMAVVNAFCRTKNLPTEIREEIIDKLFEDFYYDYDGLVMGCEKSQNFGCEFYRIHYDIKNAMQKINEEGPNEENNNELRRLQRETAMNSFLVNFNRANQSLEDKVKEFKSKMDFDQ